MDAERGTGRVVLLELPACLALTLLLLMMLSPLPARGSAGTPDFCRFIPATPAVGCKK